MTEKVKAAVIYYSAGGTNYQLARWAEEAAREAGADVRFLKAAETAPAVIESNPAWKAHAEATKYVPNASADDIAQADAVIFSVPTRYGNMAAQMKAFLDSTGGIWSKGQTVNKVVTAMTSAQNTHGGQEATLLSLYTSMFHWGAIVVSPGYTDASIFAGGGNPYGTSVSVGQDGKMVEDVEAAVKHQARRAVSVAQALKKGMRS